MNTGSLVSIEPINGGAVVSRLMWKIERRSSGFFRAHSTTAR